MLVPKSIFLSSFVFFYTATFVFADQVDTVVQIVKIPDDTAAVETLIRKASDLKGVQPKQALDAANEALDLARRMGDTMEIIHAYTHLGILYNYMSYHERALENILKGASLAEDRHLQKELADAYNQAGGVFYNQGDFDMAGKYFSKSLEIRLYLGDKENIAASYNNVGESYRLKGDHKTALEYYTRAMSINEALGRKRWLSINCANIGYIYLEENNFPKALEYFTRQNETALAGGDKKDYASPLNNLGSYYLKTNDASKAIEYFNKGLAAARDVYAKQDIIDAIKGLSEAYAMQGDHKKAYEFLSQYMMKKDSVQNNDKERELLEINLRFETVEKERAIQTLEEEKKIAELQSSRQHIIIYSLSGGIIFLVAFASVLFYANRQKRKSMNK